MTLHIPNNCFPLLLGWSYTALPFGKIILVQGQDYSWPKICSLPHLELWEELLVLHHLHYLETLVSRIKVSCLFRAYKYVLCISTEGKKQFKWQYNVSIETSTHFNIDVFVESSAPPYTTVYKSVC